MLPIEGEDSYRSVSYLKAHPDLLKIVELNRAPSRTTIREASRLPENYLKRLNDKLVEPFKKELCCRFSRLLNKEVWDVVHRQEGEG